MAIPVDVLDSIRDEYIHSRLSIAQIAKKHGLAKGTLGKVAVKERWTLLREAETEETFKKHVSVSSEPTDLTFDNAAERLIKSTARACDKLDQLLQLDEPLAPRDIKSITGSLLDIKMLMGIKSPDEKREIEARIKKLEKDAMTEKQNTEPITVIFGNREDLL